MKFTKDDPCACELRSFLGERLLLTRDKLDLTQMEFAAELNMDRRSYLALEHRESLCSSETLLIYLCYYCDDPTEFINGCKTILDKHLFLTEH